MDQSEDACEQIVAWLSSRILTKLETTYKMRDCQFRQRYWGAPIPIVRVDGHANCRG